MHISTSKIRNLISRPTSNYPDLPAKDPIYFLERAINLSRSGMMERMGGPFGCVIVYNDQIVGEGYNKVTSLNDPTAHAEVIAIREACKNLKSYELIDCDLYSSCEPCPMCLGAIYWARIRRVTFANTRTQASAIGFDDDHIYKEINVHLADRQISFIHQPHPEAERVFRDWKDWEGKQPY